MESTREPNCSTTRSLSPEPPERARQPQSGLENLIRLPEGLDRQGEGGLRTKGLFKRSTHDLPLVSIITVVFNNKAHIEQTIRSVLDQTYGNIEYIVIDGGSSDGTLDVIRMYDSKIDYWISEKDRGLYDAMNKAIRTSGGDWLNFMNSGDVYASSESLSHAMHYTNSGADVVYSDHYLRSATTGTTKKVFCDAQRLYVLHQSMIYKRELHQLHGRYLVARGMLISDYLFFNLLDRDSFIKCPQPISNNLDGGMSFNLRHVREKNAVDYLFNNVSLVRMVSIVLRELLGRRILALFKLMS